MKTRVITIVILLSFLLGSIFFVEPTEIENTDNIIQESDYNIDEDPIVEKIGEEISVYNHNDELMFSLDELSAIYDFQYKFDSFEGSIEIMLDDSLFYMLQGTKIVSKDGVYLPNSYEPYINDENKVFLNIDMLENIFAFNYKSANSEQVIEVFANEDIGSSDDIFKDFKGFEEKFPSMTEEDMINYLSFLSVPIDGAHLTTRDSQMPGADRSYRNGTHEGIDWYAGYTGVNIDKSTPVLSMADGVVVRADSDYVELTYEERDNILGIAANSDHTSQAILDKLRGCSVWVQYDKGVMVRYAHLSQIVDGIEVGKSVERGEILGYVGNTGTSYSLDGNNLGLHLHSDILIYNHLFWENFSFEQSRNILEVIFP